MKRVTYAESSFLTDDRLADALLAYASALAMRGQADVVQIPGVDETGTVRRFALVIGPASQMVASEVDDEPVAMDAEPTITDLRERQQRRLPPDPEDMFAAFESEAHPDGTHGGDPEGA